VTSSPCSTRGWRISKRDWPSDGAVRSIGERCERVYRTYATTARGVDRLLFVNNILDLAPYGRLEDWEDSPAGWPQHPTYG